MRARLSVDAAKEKWSLHFAEFPLDKLVVGHIDNNKLNFNIENIELIPQQLNLMSQRPEPSLTYNGKYHGKVECRFKDFHIKTLSTRNEALHALDVMKIHAAPAHFRPYLFQHCMHKPIQFTEAYSSVQNLLLSVNRYLPRPKAKSNNVRKNLNKYVAYASKDAALKKLPPDLKKSLLETLNATGLEKYDNSYL